MDDATWFAEHTAYLATPEWAFRRGQVLHRDGYRCQARLPGCAGEATQVHHLNYKHWRNEPLFDLTSVCSRCHESITEMDRDQRPHESRSGRVKSVWERESLGFDPIADESRTSLSDQLRELLQHRAMDMFELVERTGATHIQVRRALRRMPNVIEVPNTPGHGLRWAILDPVSVGFEIPS